MSMPSVRGANPAICARLPRRRKGAQCCLSARPAPSPGSAHVCVRERVHALVRAAKLTRQLSVYAQVRALAGLLEPRGGGLYAAAPRSVVLQNPDHQVVMPGVRADVAFGMGAPHAGRVPPSPREARLRADAALAAVGLQVRRGSVLSCAS